MINCIAIAITLQLVSSMPLACSVDISPSQPVHQVGLFGLGLVECEQVSVRDPEANADRENTRTRLLVPIKLCTYA